MAVAASGSESGPGGVARWRIAEPDPFQAFVGEVAVQRPGGKLGAFSAVVEAADLDEAVELVTGNAVELVRLPLPAPGPGDLPDVDEPVDAPGLPDFSTSDTSSYVAEVQDWFRLFGPAMRANLATPRNLSPFLDYLAGVTEQAVKVASTQPVPGGSPQFEIDMARWVRRLSDYRREVATAIASGEVDSHSVVLRTVTEPVLLGFYSDPPPEGVTVPDSGQGLLDAVTPVRLAHQAEVTKEHLDEAWGKLADDLVESAKNVGKKIIGGVKKAAGASVAIWLLLSAAGATVLALGVGTWYALRDRGDARTRR